MHVWQRTRSSSLLVLFLLVVTLSLLADQYSPPAGVKLEVVSSKVLTEKEASVRTSPDVIGLNIAVRLRLSLSGKGIFYFTWKDSVIPIGHDVRISDTKMVWQHGTPSGQEHPTSPGIERLKQGGPCAWAWLPAYSSIEWEVLDSTARSGEKHAFTIFIKESRDSEPREIVSEAFIVPAGVDVVRTPSKEPL